MRIAESVQAYPAKTSTISAATQMMIVMTMVMMDVVMIVIMLIVMMARLTSQSAYASTKKHMCPESP
jgi:hypothetical protein